MNTPNDMNKSELPKLELSQTPCHEWVVTIDHPETATSVGYDEQVTIFFKKKDLPGAIVHRVNNWDKLVEALEDAGKIINEFGINCFSSIGDKKVQDMANKITNALTLAKEGI